MKNLLIAATTVLMAIISSFFANASVSNTNPNKSRTFEIGMYQGINSLIINVMIEKVEDQQLFVILKDEKGKVLATEKIAKYKSNYHGRFDMTNLEDGKYTFEFTKGDEKIIKEIEVKSTKPEEFIRKITL
jgi:hypothetical protein